jgi:hypothetical protein
MISYPDNQNESRQVNGILTVMDNLKSELFQGAHV